MAASLRLQELAEEIRTCTACSLWRSRREAVPGQGRPGAKVFFVGEAPGRQEDMTGLPFVGRAGRVLDAALQAAGLRREEAFITSVVKCKPPGREKPKRGQVETCTNLYLFQQIEAVDPMVIVPLGNFGLKALLGWKATVGKCRGKEFRWRRWRVWPTYHPAASFRNPRARRELEEDLRAVALLLKGRPTAAPAGPGPGRGRGGRRGRGVSGGARRGHRGAGR